MGDEKKSAKSGYGSINLMPEEIKEKIRDEKKVRKLEITSAVFGIVLGVLLHFTFKWFGNNMFVGLFSAVNESVWEYTKLFFFPLLIFMFIEYCFLRDVKELFHAKIAESFFGIIFIICFFYTYTGIFGFESLNIDIASFVFAVIAGRYLSYKIIIGNKEPKMPLLASSFLFVLVLSFYVFSTFTPFRIPLFRDVKSNTYGINSIK